MASAEIRGGYENITVTCLHCGTRNVYNRASDLGGFDSIAHLTVTCTNAACAKSFDISGDLINPPQEMMLLDAADFLKEKRYIQAVLSATTAYEYFFSHFLRVQLIYRPERRDRTTRDSLKWLNSARELLENETATMAFWAMRQAFLRAAVDDVRPKTMADAESYIQGIAGKKPQVNRTDIEAVTIEPRRDLLLRVFDSKIATLRNNVVHKSAYRPNLTQTRAVLEDGYATLFGLGRHYRLGDDNYHLNAPPDDD